MSQQERALETVDMLYRAAVEPDLWPAALERFALSVGCIGMAMIPITPNNTAGLIVSPSMREVEAEYRREWWRHDTRVGRIFARKLSRGVFCEAQLFGEEELAKDPFRQDFCRRYGIGAFAAQLLEPWPGHVVAFSGQRAVKRGQFEGEELDRLRWLGRHAARALTISMKIATGDAVVDGLLEMLERFEGGVFVLNAQGEVALMNARAERLLGDGLGVAKRRLTAAHPDRQHAVDQLVSSALGRAGSAAASAPIALPRPSGRKPLLVQAMPLSSRRALDELESSGLRTSGGLLLVLDPEPQAGTQHESLRLLGLTAAEARLAALVGGGMRRRDAAALLGISEWTARDALKAIYSKLNIRSASELARLACTVAAVERRPEAG